MTATVCELRRQVQAVYDDWQSRSAAWTAREALVAEELLNARLAVIHADQVLEAHDPGCPALAIR